MNKAEEIAQEIHKIENGDLPEFIKNRNNQNQTGKVKKNQEKSAKKVQQTKSTQTQSNSKDQLKNHFSKLLNLASMPDNLSLSFFSNVLAWKIATLDETSEEYQQALADKKEFDKKKGKEQEQWKKWKTDRHKEKKINDKLKVELVDKIVDLLEQKFK